MRGEERILPPQENEWMQRAQEWLDQNPGTRPEGEPAPESDAHTDADASGDSYPGAKLF